MRLRDMFMTSCLMLTTAQVVKAEGQSSGLFVEPAITYELGTTSVDYPSPFSNSTGNANGFGVGAKLGIHLSEALILGFDGRYSMPQFTDSSVGYDAKSVSTNWGPVVGLQMPDLGLRILGTFIIDGELNPERSNSFDVSFKKATGYRLGAGFRIAAVSLNLEYQQLKYGEAALEQMGPFTSTSTFNNVNLENKTWIASVSFPLEL